jgi:hypothetical protein
LGSPGDSAKREIADFCLKLTDAVREADKPFWRM